MKRFLIFILSTLMIIACAMGLTACGDKEYSINFMVEGRQYYVIRTRGEESIILPEEPQKEGYDFKGWFFDENIWEKPFSNDYFEKIKIDGDVSVYAKFSETHLHSYTESVVESTCTNNGYKLHICDCGSEYKDEYTKSLGHLLEHTIVNESTCTKKGTEKVKCLRKDCQYEEELSLPFLEHRCNNMFICQECGYENTTAKNLTLKLDLTTDSYYVDSCNNQAEKVEIPAYFNGKPVSKISDEAFIDCKSLQSIYFPNTIKNIGQKAFFGCEQLKSVYISSLLQWCSLDFSNLDTDYQSSKGNNPLSYGANLYLNNELIKNLVIPTEVVEIGDFVFDNCLSFESITISENVIKIGRNAFRNCKNVKTIYYNAFDCYANETYALYSVGSTVFNSVGKDTDGVRLVIGNGVKNIPGSMFYGASTYQPGATHKQNAPKITKVEFEEGSICESIGPYAFACCGELIEVSLPNSITEIKSDAFMFCEKLKTIEMSENIKRIEYDAFEKCNSIEVTSLDGINYLGNKENPYIVAISAIKNSKTTQIFLNDECKLYMSGIFSSMSELETIHFKGSIFDWAKVSFSNAESSPVKHVKNIYIGNELISKIKSIDLTQFNDRLGAYSFSNWTWLENITFSEGLSEIPEGFLYNCDSLTKVSFPSTLRQIGKESFYDCDALYDLEFPDKLEKICWGAFQSCNSLVEINIPNSVVVLDEWTFSHCINLESVIVSSGVSKLEYVFQSSKNLNKIILDKSIKEIETLCFFGCISIEYIFYTGTVDDWKSVIVGDNNGTFTSDKVYFYYEEVPAIKGQYWHYVNGQPKIWEAHWHSYTEQKVENIYLKTAATCSEKAEYYYSCVCGEKGNDSFKFGELELHNYGFDFKCKECLHESESLKYLTLELSNNSDGYIVSKCENNVSSIEIPGYYNDLPIIGIGFSAFNNCSNLSVLKIPKTITEINASFSNCNNLRMVHISDLSAWCNIEFSIMHCAFGGMGVYTGPTEDVEVDSNPLSVGAALCLNGNIITDLIIPEGVNTIKAGAFYGANINSVFIPKTCKGIGAAAFEYSKISMVTFDECSSVEFIEDSSFRHCSNLESITLPEKLVKIEYAAFEDCIKMESVLFVDNASLKSIDEFAFYNCTALSAMKIPNSIEHIGYNAFEKCNNDLFTEKNYGVYIGNTENNYLILLKTTLNENNQSMYYIPPSQDENENAIESFNIVSKTKVIADKAFFECNDLRTIKIPASVEKIGEMAFWYCDSLMTIDVDKNNLRYSSIDGNLYDKKGEELIKYAPGKKEGKFITPETLKKILPYAFMSCSSLETVTLSEGIERIDKESFCGGYSIKTVEIPSSVKIIDEKAFYNTRINNVTFTADSKLEYIGKSAFEESSIEKIIIPSNVKTIDTNAFYWSRLQEILFADNSLLKTIERGAFGRCSSIKSILIPSSVEKIGDGAFAGNQYDTMLLEEVIFEENSSLQELGKGVFNGCILLNIHIDDGNENFKCIDGILYNADCSSLIKYSSGKNEDNATVIDGVIRIKQGAFANSYNLVSIELPNSIRSIEQDAFKNCTSLEKVYYNGTLEEWCNIEFGSNANPLHNGADLYINNVLLTELNIPNSLSEITDIFKGCTSLVNLVIPANVKDIKSNAFDGCKNLTTIKISEGVESIGSYAFSNCFSLKNISIGYGVNNIGSQAFASCTSLQTISIPSSVIKIESYAFRNCENLLTISIPKNVTLIGSSILDGCNKINTITLPFLGTAAEQGQNMYLGYLFGGATSTNVNTKVPESLKKVVLIGDLSRIEGYAFWKCSSIEEIIIPNSVEFIGYGAFAYCSSLKDIILPSKLTKIDEYAFYECTTLKSVTIGINVKYIGKAAFYKCSNLTSASFESKSSWWLATNATDITGTAVGSSSLSSKSNAAYYLTQYWSGYYWKKG